MEDGGKKKVVGPRSQEGENEGIEAPSVEAIGGIGGALTLLFTSTMLSGLRAGVLCSLAMAGRAGGPGSVPQAARRGAGAQPGGPARAAPPLAVALAPPSHPDLDVKGAATESGTRSPRFLGNSDGDDTPSCSYVITLCPCVPGARGGARQSQWRVM